MPALYHPDGSPPPPAADGRSRRRLSSTAVRIGMISALSVALVSCSSDDPDDDTETTAYCVEDESTVSPSPTASPSPAEEGYREVDDSNCDDDDRTSYSSGTHSYFWYYGARRSASGLITGGTRIRPEGKISTPSGRVIQRGGFGGRGGSGG